MDSEMVEIACVMVFFKKKQIGKQIGKMIISMTYLVNCVVNFHLTDVSYV